MAFIYAPQVPQAFANELRDMSKQVIVEVLWDCLVLLSGDEGTAPEVQIHRVHEIAKIYKDMRKDAKKARKG